MAAKPASLHAAATQQSRSSAPKQRPNILLLFPDQWRFDWMSSNPALPIHTPNLDRIASRAMSFEKVVVAAPVCAPSRSCLASGMEYDHQFVMNNNLNYPKRQTTFYQLLRDSGYHVLGCGKMDLAKGADWWGIDGKWRIHSWGFSDGINNAGKWDQVSGFEWNNNYPADPYLTYLAQQHLLQMHLADYKSRRKPGYAATHPTPLPDDAYCDNWVTRNALTLLDEAPANKPWFLQINWASPHDPEDITVRMEQTVRGRKMPPVNGADQYDSAKNQLIRQNYTAMCENIDRNIGILLDWLDAKHQTKDTLIIFSSDHGEMLGDHGRWGKSLPYSPSTGVPMLLAGPGVKPGVRSSALVSSIDLTATILDYGGLTDAEMDGRSFRPVLEGRTSEHRRVVYSGLGQWRMVWDGRYKVITGFVPAGKRKETNIPEYDRPLTERMPVVFDLKEDPGENHDLSASMPLPARALLDDLRTGKYPA